MSTISPGPDGSPPASKLRYRYHTQEFGGFDIHYRTLRDRQQFEDIDNAAENLGVPPASWPMFGVVWQAGEVLARLMADYEVENLRILEIGCGVGLASLVLNKRHADISATDIHPSAQDYLDHNTELNGDPLIPFFRCAWDDPGKPDFGAFDLIIASDVMFEPDHLEKLIEFIQEHAQEKCEIILSDAGRGYAGKFNRAMEKLGYVSDELSGFAPFTAAEKFKGKIHRHRRGFQDCSTPSPG